MENSNKFLQHVAAFFLKFSRLIKIKQQYILVFKFESSLLLKPNQPENAFPKLEFFYLSQ